VPRKPDPADPLQWSVFRAGEQVAVVPRAPLLIRLRQFTSDAFFAQEALKPLKSLMDTNFVIGPVCILSALYLPFGGTVLIIVGILSLCLSALYWFTSHWLCSTYLRYRGFTEGEPVTAPDLDAARAAV
jgi:hypothetical protein